jgi:hypothetical protein
MTCPVCNAVFKESRPLSREDYLPTAPDPALAGIRRGAKWLLVFSVIGCTSPLALLIGAVWYSNNKRQIAAAGPATRTLVLISLLICVVYLVMVSGGALVFFLRRAAS